MAPWGEGLYYGFSRIPSLILEREKPSIGKNGTYFNVYSWFPVRVNILERLLDHM